MQTQELAHFAHELREVIERGALAHRDRVEMSDGLTVDAERMALIVLADLDRLDRQDPPGWLTDREQQHLQDDLLRLLALVPAVVRA